MVLLGGVVMPLFLWNELTAAESRELFLMTLRGHDLRRLSDRRTAGADTSSSPLVRPRACPAASVPDSPVKETMSSTRQAIRELVHQRQGPLTQELLLEPGDFGLGKVPSKLDGLTRRPTWSAVTARRVAVSGSTLERARQQNLSPATESPVNLGMACPKGWEALTVLDSPERARTPLFRDDSGRLKPVDWHQAMTTFVARFKGIQAEHGPQSVAFLSTGQIPTEEMAFLGALAKFGMACCMATATLGSVWPPPWLRTNRRSASTHRPTRMRTSRNRTSSC